MSAAPSKRGTLTAALSLKPLPGLLAAGLATAVAAPLFVAPSTGGARAAARAPTASQPAASDRSSVGTSAVAMSMLGVAAASARRAKVLRQSAETFQQQAMEYPAAYENIAETNEREKQADIICTIGPKSWDPEAFESSYRFFALGLGEVDGGRHERDPLQHVAWRPRGPKTGKLQKGSSN